MEGNYCSIPQKPMLSILRIYIANKLVSQYGIETFSRQSIDCIAIHVYQNLVELMIGMKRVLAAQRRTIPNLLHFLFACESSGYHLDSFITYLVDKAEEKNHKLSRALNRNKIKSLLDKNIFSSENKYEDYGHSNILNIPLNFAQSKQIHHHPLTIKMPISLYVEKPLSFCYSNECETVEKIYKNSSQIMNQQMLARKNIKQSLSILKKKVKCQEGDKNQNQVREKNQIRRNFSFELAKYL